MLQAHFFIFSHDAMYRRQSVSLFAYEIGLDLIKLLACVTCLLALVLFVACIIRRLFLFGSNVGRRLHKSLFILNRNLSSNEHL